MKRISWFLVGTVAGIALTTAINGQQHEIQDAVKVSPQYYSVRLENERVRVLDFRLKPGEKEAMHSHASGVAYIVGSAKVRTSFPDGASVEGDLTAGDVHWREKTVMHTVENIGDTEAHAIIVELKDVRSKTQSAKTLLAQR
jgi:quercetin dioxygenase-like cupin family protein